MRILKVFIGLCAIVVFAGDVYAQEKREIVFGCETSLLPSLVWVAENKGYFQEEGVKVKIVEFDSGRAALKAMLEEGNLDMVTVAQTPVVFNSFTRNDYVIISAMVSSENDVKIIARKDRGIKNPSDLKGKKIGMTYGSTGHFFLALFLTHNGILFSEVEAVNLKTGELVRALVEGTVDAISSWEPNIANAKKTLGENGILLRGIVEGRGIFREDFYFVPKRDFLKNNQNALKKFLKAAKRAEEFIRKNKEEAINIVSQRLKIDNKLTASLWNDFNFQLFLDQTILMTLEDEARWMMKDKLTDKTETPNYLDFIYSNLLEEVKPEAVTIIK